MAKKQFALRADQIKPLAKGRGGCLATDMITVNGCKVGYMYREQPDNDIDSGWAIHGRDRVAVVPGSTRTTSKSTMSTLSPITDQEIIPILERSRYGSAFERERHSGKFSGSSVKRRIITPNIS